MEKRKVVTKAAAPKAPKKAKAPKAPKPASDKRRSQDHPEAFKKQISVILGKDRVAITDLKKQLREEKWKNVSNRGDKLEKACRALGFTIKKEKVADGEGVRTYVLDPEKYEEPKEKEKKDAA